MKRGIGLVLMAVLVLMIQPALAQEWQMPQGQKYEWSPGRLRPNSLAPATIQGPFSVIAVQKEGAALVVFLHDNSYIVCRDPAYISTLAAIGCSALVGGRTLLLNVEGDTLVGYQMN